MGTFWGPRFEFSLSLSLYLFSGYAWEVSSRLTRSYSRAALLRRHAMFNRFSASHFDLHFHS